MAADRHFAAAPQSATPFVGPNEGCAYPWIECVTAWAAAPLKLRWPSSGFTTSNRFEALAQDEDTKLLCLQMAAMSKAGKLAPFITTLHDDGDVDEATKGTIAEIASDEQFLLAVEDYVRRTACFH